MNILCRGAVLAPSCPNHRTFEGIRPAPLQRRKIFKNVESMRSFQRLSEIEYYS